MSTGSSVGIIANPAAGKDIRRLVAHGRFVSNPEKINFLRRVLVGLEAAGVERVIFMPDVGMLGSGAISNNSLALSVEFLDMPVFNDEIDSTRAAGRMRDMGVGCLITLGGDGTNRLVAKESLNVPNVPISTGTNNVFPQMIEGTVAGLAAGVVASRVVNLDKVVTTAPKLDVSVDGEFKDIALVDIAVTREQFVGSRAVWNMGTIHEVFLARTDSDSIGLSSIGGRLPVPFGEGVQVMLGDGNIVVNAPVAPGSVSHVPIRDWWPMKPGTQYDVGLKPSTIAFDGERSFTLRKDESATVTLSLDGPKVVSVEKALRMATLAGVFTEGNK